MTLCSDRGTCGACANLGSLYDTKAGDPAVSMLGGTVVPLIVGNGGLGSFPENSGDLHLHSPVHRRHPNPNPNPDNVTQIRHVQISEEECEL